MSKFLECFPPLRPIWRPVTESSLWADLLDGRVRLQGKVDLTARHRERPPGRQGHHRSEDRRHQHHAPRRPALLRPGRDAPHRRAAPPHRLLLPRLGNAAHRGGDRGAPRLHRRPHRRRRPPLRRPPERVGRAGEARPRSCAAGARSWTLRPGPRPPASRRPRVDVSGDEAAPAERSGRSPAGRPRMPDRSRGVPCAGCPRPTGPAPAGPHDSSRTAVGRRTRCAARPTPRSCTCRWPSGTTDAEVRRSTRAWATSTSGAAASTCGRSPARLYAPLYEKLVPGRVGGPREDPDRGWRAARRQPRRRHPLRRPGDHARHRDRARAAGLRPGRPRSSRARRSSARCGPATAASSPTPTTPTACCASSSSSCSCSPRARRARARPTTSATGCAASVGAASSRSPCGPACPIVPIAVVGAEESMPILSKVPALAKALGMPYFPITANMLLLGPLGVGRLLPGQVQAAGARPGHLRRRRARPAPLLAQPDHGRVRGHPAADPGSALRHAPPAPLRLVRLTTGALMGRRVLVTGLGTFWGGRVAQALEADAGRRRDHRPRHRRAAGPPRAHRVRPQRRELLDPHPHRAGHQGRHDRPHVPRRRLDPDVGAHACTRSTSSAR